MREEKVPVTRLCEPFALRAGLGLLESSSAAAELLWPNPCKSGRFTQLQREAAMADTEIMWRFCRAEPCQRSLVRPIARGEAGLLP